MIATKILLLMVMGLTGRENGRKAKNCRVLRRVRARYIGILGSLSVAVVPKKRQRNVQKSVLHEQSSFFLLIRPTDFFGCFRCRRRLALHDFIFYLSKL